MNIETSLTSTRRTLPDRDPREGRSRNLEASETLEDYETSTKCAPPIVKVPQAPKHEDADGKDATEYVAALIWH